MSALNNDIPHPDSRMDENTVEFLYNTIFLHNTP